MSRTVGVLSLHNSKETKAILNAVDELGHEPVWLRRENVQVAIEDGVTASPSVDVVANRLLLSSSEQPCELLGLANTYLPLVPMLNRPEKVLTAFHKFATAAALAERDIRVPDAFLALDADVLNANRTRFGEEAVYKTAIGTHGGGTWKVGADEQVNPMVGSRFAFLQSLLDQDPDARNRDLRVYIVDGDIVGAMYRYAPDEDWRTNVALGGDVEPADPVPDEAAAFALEATDELGLDYAGVDLVEGTDGWYVLEVNPTAGFRGLFKATGVSPAPYIAKHAIEQAGGEVDEAAVERLAGTLDDSKPRGAPSGSSTSLDQAKVVGYTEDVVVSGTSGSERVLGKSDTGASRTSIDTRLAARIGAGPIKSMTKVKSGSVSSGKSRPVVDIVVGVGGDQHTVAASLVDRSHMDYPLLLGRDILENYQVDVTRRHDEAEGETEEEEVDTEE